jgi:hypothetical protein
MYILLRSWEEGLGDAVPEKNLNSSKIREKTHMTVFFL